MIEGIDVEGRCSCGAVHMTVRGHLVAMAECWCDDCQKETGGGSTRSVIVASEHVEMSGRDIGEHRRASDRGSQVVRRFCRSCGDVMMADVEDMPFSAVRLGAPDNRSFFRPQMVLFTKSAPAWAPFPEGAQLFETQPAAAD
ncbi:GFA family protein [Aureimonas mangrovi]|uniref:GFA family protein n=1 Tax=Aureimonas mangrovi TaxID=2758041 RepID=UPI00163DD28C|nr:GFA family protein [Aureimonas mangrovi]